MPEDLLTKFHGTGKRPGYRRAEHSVFKIWKSWIDARHLYPRIAVTVALVYSRYDCSTPEEREQNELVIRDAELITIDAAGHFASLERLA